MTVYVDKKPCSIPENPERIKIWRYMSLEKFLYLLQNKTLYMVSVHTLFERYEELEGKLYPETIQLSYENGRPMIQCLKQRARAFMSLSITFTKTAIISWSARAFPEDFIKENRQ